MRSLPRLAQLYIVVLIAATAVVLGRAFTVFQPTPLSCLAVAIFSLTLVLADCFPIVLPPNENMEVTVSGTIKTAAVIALGPPEAIMISFFGTLIADIMTKKAWYKTALNVAVMTLTVAMMSVAYEGLSVRVREPFDSFRNAWAVSVVLLIFYFLNTGLMTIIISLISGMQVAHIWRTYFLNSIWTNMTLIPLGALMGQLWLYRPWSVFILIFPIVVIRQSFKLVAELQRQTRSSLISMADAIDQRDPSTFQHSQRVAIVAEALAEAMSVRPEDIETLRFAARLHDLGKIGMSDALLFKPGPLSDGERLQFRRHPDIGADIVKSFSLFNEGQDLIRYHHERFDGRGYPLALAAEDIPLGSRILAVADSLDAMTSIRPYRSPVTTREAIAEILANSGTQFDPRVVGAFQRLIQQWEGELPWKKAPVAVGPPVEGGSPGGDGPSRVSPASG